MSFGEFARRLEGALIRREMAQWSAILTCIVDALVGLFCVGIKLVLPHSEESRG